MSQFRRDIITGEWMIISEQRKGRPYQYGENEEKNACPFCPGNEHMTPNEIMREEDEHGWKMRVVPNKYPAVCAQDGLMDEDTLFYAMCEATGRHEVVVETASHEQMLHHMEDEKIFDVFSAFKERFVELSRIEDIKYVQIFKNHGRNGGASIRHSHSQIVAMPFIPPRVQLELEGAYRYYQSDGKCAYCEMIKKEIEYQQRLLCKNEHFIAVLAFAPRFAYETWIIPLDHQAVFSQADDASIISLVSIYKKIMEMFTNILGEFPYNLVVHTAPYHFTDQYYHWHIELIPRVTYHAGFELATGACISVISPEEAARIIKKEV